MDELSTIAFEREGRIARITLDRPERGNGITNRMAAEIAACVEEANLDPEVHAIALAGNGSGFCGGYDLVASAEGEMAGISGEAPEGSPLDPAVIAANHAPESNWDPVTDYQFMSRNVRGFMSLFHSEKPVLCKVHGYCVAGGTDMALCSDLLVIAEDAKIGYPPARVWGSPTTAIWAHRIGIMRAKRLLLTGDSLTGAEAAEWGLATEAAPAAQLDARFERLLDRVARLPVNQLVMMKLLTNQVAYAQGLHQTQILGTFFDGIARHTEEGHGFVRRAAEAGFKQAVRDRDEPFGDFGLEGFGIAQSGPRDAASKQLRGDAGIDPRAGRGLLPRPARDRPGRDQRSQGDRAGGRRRAPSAPRRLRARRRLGRARRQRRRLGDLPQPPARLRLHDARDEAERVRGGGRGRRADRHRRAAPHRRPHPGMGGADPPRRAPGGPVHRHPVRDRAAGLSDGAERGARRRTSSC